MQVGKIESRLRKLLSLAERGVGGEKDNASRMLTLLLRKHGLDISDILEDKVETCWFKYKGNIEKRLLSQIFCAVANDADRWTSRKKRETLGIDVTNQQMLEIRLMFACYKKSLNDDIEILFSAFIHKNDIFSPKENIEPESQEPRTPEEKARIFKISQMMNNMDKTTVLKAIESKSIN